MSAVPVESLGMDGKFVKVMACGFAVMALLAAAVVA